MQNPKSKIQNLESFLAAALSGIMLVMCFPKIHLPGLVWVACMPVLAVLAGEKRLKRAFLLGAVDDFFTRHRMAILIGVVAVVVGGLPLLHWLRFDFNPINLRDPHSKSIATYLELSHDPTTDANAIELLAPDLDKAHAIAARVSKLAEVSHALTLSSFIPDQQAEKLPLIAAAATALKDAFDPKNAEPPPTDAQNVGALNEGALRLTAAASDQNGVGVGAGAATRLATALTALAKAPEATRIRAGALFVDPLRADLDALAPRCGRNP